MNERILRQWQQTYLEKLLAFCSVFFLQGPTEERWKRLRERLSARFPKYSSVTLKSQNLQGSWFLPNKLFQHGDFVFTFSETLSCVLLFLWGNKNVFSWRLSNDCHIARPALVSGPPNWKKPYNKHLISRFFSVRTVNYVIYSTDRKLG